MDRKMHLKDAGQSLPISQTPGDRTAPPSMCLQCQGWQLWMASTSVPFHHVQSNQRHCWVLNHCSHRDQCGALSTVQQPLAGTALIFVKINTALYHLLFLPASVTSGLRRWVRGVVPIPHKKFTLRKRCPSTEHVTTGCYRPTVYPITRISQANRTMREPTIGSLEEYA